MKDVFISIIVLTLLVATSLSIIGVKRRADHIILGGAACFVAAGIVYFLLYPEF